MRRGPIQAETRIFLLALVAGLLAIQALRAFFASIYYHNLTAMELDRSALAVLLLLSPALLLVPRVTRDVWTWLAGSALVLAAARTAMAFTWGTLAYVATTGVAAAAFFVLLPSLLVNARRLGGLHGPGLVAAGLALAWAADAGILLLRHSTDVTTGPGTWGFAAPWSLVLVLLALTTPRSAGTFTLYGQRGLAPALLAGVALGAWLFLENVVVGSPYSIMRWSGTPLWAASAAVLLGLLLPLVALLARPPLPFPLLVALNVLGFVGLVDHANWHTPFVPVLILLTQAALVVDLVVLAGILADAPLPRVGLATLLAVTVMVLLHFASAFSFTFAFVPLGPFWQGQEAVQAPLAFLLVVLGIAPHLRAWQARIQVPPVPRRILLALLALVLLLPAIGLAGTPAPVVAPPPGEPIRVATLNVHQGFNNQGALDPELFTRLVRSLDADLVALQESDTPRFTSGNLDINAVLAHALGYHRYDGPMSSEQSVGVSLLSRFPIVEARYHRLPTFTDNRFYIEARLDVHGQDLWVFANHFGLPAPDRMAQATALLQGMDGKTPRIVLGDLNSCPSGLCPGDDEPDDVYARLTEEHDDAWVAAGHDVDAPEGHTWEASRPSQRIDYIFVSRELRVLAVERITSDYALAASDHLPMVAEVVLET